MKRIYVMGLCLIVIAAVAIGLFWHGGYMTLPKSLWAGEFKGSHSAASVPEATTHASVTASAETIAEPMPGDYQRWRSELVSGCTVGSTSLHIQHFDVNGDGLPDTVCWRTLKTKSTGDFVDLMARVVRTNGQAQVAYIILPANSGEQAAICDADHVKVGQSLWTHKMFDDMGWPYVGPISITLSDGTCDPAWLFWPADAKGADVDFDFERM